MIVVSVLHVPHESEHVQYLMSLYDLLWSELWTVQKRGNIECHTSWHEVMNKETFVC